MAWDLSSHVSASSLESRLLLKYMRAKWWQHHLEMYLGSFIAVFDGKYEDDEDWLAADAKTRRLLKRISKLHARTINTGAGI